MRFVPPIRVFIAMMIFMSAFTNYMLKANISVSIGEMAKPVQKEKNDKDDITCEGHSPVKNKTKEKQEKFDWDDIEQTQVIAAYFYGNMVTFLPGGTIAELLGPCNVIFWTTIVSAMLTALTPLCAFYTGFAGTLINRLLIGILGGPVYPALNVLIAKWAPPNEKGKFLAMLLGNTIGVVITWIMVGHTTSSWGWPAGFFSVAAFLILFCIVFIIVCRDSPDEHPWITEKEKNFIKEAQGGTVSKAKKIPPYRAIFMSIPFWSTIVAQFGNLWVLNLLLTFAPKYFKDVLKFNLKAAVQYAALPYIGRLVFSQIFGTVGDYMRQKQVMSVTKLRKFFMIFSHFIPAVLMSLVYAAGCHWEWVFVLLIVNQLLNGAVVVGHLVNCQDLAPNFAGTLYGIMNFLGGITGFIVPTLGGVIMDHMHDKVLAASIIFIMGGVIMAACGAVFIVFGSGEVQPWNYKKQEAQQDEPQEDAPK